jgi:hypothetical protein
MPSISSYYMQEEDREDTFEKFTYR